MGSEFQTHLLIIGGGREIPDLAREARPGLRTTVFCRSEVLPRVRNAGANTRVFVFQDGRPADEWVRAARWVNEIDPVTFVATYSEKDQDKAAAIGAALGLRAPSAETIRRVHDKAEMRQALAAAGVDDTVAIDASTLPELIERAGKLGFPLIVKPVRGVASKGVSRVNSQDELPGAWQRARQAAIVLDDQRVLAEPFYEGREYSVESISENGRHVVVCVVAKRVDPVSYVEVGHLVPAPLADHERARIAETVTSALRELGIRDGVTHTEVIVERRDGTVRIIETHLRPAGDEIPAMVDDTLGIDLIAALARQSVGFEVLPGVLAALAAGDRGRGKFAAIGYAVSHATGEIIEVQGVTAAQDSADVTDVEILRGPGDQLDGLLDSGGRLAHARGVGETAEAAVKSVAEALSQLSFIVRIETA